MLLCLFFLKKLFLTLRFLLQLACQDEDTEGDEDDQEAEYDSMLMEYAGELIACLNKVVPWQQFGPYLAGLMPFLFARTVCLI